MKINDNVNNLYIILINILIKFFQILDIIYILLVKVIYLYY